MSRYGGRRDFRSPRWYLALVCVSELLFLAGAHYMYRTNGFALLTLVSIGMSIIGVLAIIETLRARVELTDDALRITRFWSTRSYPRERIVAVYSAKGVSTKVEVEKGKLVELPPVGGSVNSIRAWIKSKD